MAIPANTIQGSAAVLTIADTLAGLDEADVIKVDNATSVTIPLNLNSDTATPINNPGGWEQSYISGRNAQMTINAQKIKPDPGLTKLKDRYFNAKGVFFARILEEENGNGYEGCFVLTSIDDGAAGASSATWTSAANLNGELTLITG